MQSILSIIAIATMLLSGCQLQQIGHNREDSVSREVALKLAKAEFHKIRAKLPADANISVVDHQESGEWLVVFDLEYPDPGSATMVTVDKETGKTRVLFGR